MNHGRPSAASAFFNSLLEQQLGYIPEVPMEAGDPA